MGTQKERKMTIARIKSTFYNAEGKAIDRKKLTAEICLLHGLKKETVAGYFELLIDSGIIKEDEFGLWLVSDDKPDTM